MSTQSLRDLVKLSISGAKAVSIELQKDDSTEVEVISAIFNEFVVEEKSAVGTTNNGATVVVVIFPKKECEEGRKPIVVFGQ